jgi:hypothetical protein
VSVFVFFTARFVSEGLETFGHKKCPKVPTDTGISSAEANCRCLWSSNKTFDEGKKGRKEGAGKGEGGRGRAREA